MKPKNNVYLSLSEIISVLSGASYDDIKRLNILFNSIKCGDFYTAYGNLIEKTDNANVRKLVSNIFDYYVIGKKEKSEKEFFSNLEMLFGAIYNNSAKDTQNLMLTILSVTDQKTKYDLLKWLAKVIKNERVKDRVYLALLDNKFAGLDDFNTYLTRFIDNNISLSDEALNNVFLDWVVQIKKYVLVTNCSDEEFDFLFFKINQILVKLAERYPEIVNNIRYVCDIQPSGHYEHGYYNRLYSGAKDIMSYNTARLAELSEKVKQQDRMILNLQIANEQLEKKLLETSSEREKKLMNELKELMRTNDKLTQEIEKLEQAEAAAKSCADVYRRMLNKSRKK